LDGVKTKKKNKFYGK